MDKKTLVIAGGGTGGHIYPGLALADHLKKQHPEWQVHFVGAKGGLEESIIPRYHYPLHCLRMDRLHSSAGWKKRLRAMVLMPFAIIHSMYLYFKIKPTWVLGVGGFASGPFVLTASLLGGNTALLEPNAYPGMANRWLSKVVRYCFVVFDNSLKFFPKAKVRQVGLPVRMKKGSPGTSYDKNQPLNLLVFGGSQGSVAINEVVGEWVEHMGMQAPHYKILHQVGSRDFARWQKRYGEKYKHFLEYCEYIHDMPEKLKWADLVICRAGVGTVAEIAMSCRPAIFIPLPTAADNHQQKNAEALVNKQAALMILQKDFYWENLQRQVKELRENPQQLDLMKQNLMTIDYSKAPEQIIGALVKGNA
ncbi:MAG: undecaprenyldiphospho-muramoylpentapeptide beta-N-acetylglucosaminyltransferase [Bdellovibrionales bacterium]|nr:undecaprenyldiphospho-muramoylpentapeptide beta-N-acetylglucosaminyltransferase [Bdellovibrionales bacterium]